MSWHISLYAERSAKDLAAYLAKSAQQAVDAKIPQLTLCPLEVAAWLKRLSKDTAWLVGSRERGKPPSQRLCWWCFVPARAALDMGLADGRSVGMIACFPPFCSGVCSERWCDFSFGRMVALT